MAGPAAGPHAEARFVRHTALTTERAIITHRLTLIIPCLCLAAAGGCVPRSTRQLRPVACPAGARGSAILGQVLDDTTGAPIPQAYVRFYRDSSATPITTATADKFGRYVLTGLPSGPGVLGAIQIGYRERRRSVVVDTLACWRVDLRLPWRASPTEPSLPTEPLVSR